MDIKTYATDPCPEQPARRAGRSGLNTLVNSAGLALLDDNKAIDMLFVCKVAGLVYTD